MSSNITIEKNNILLVEGNDDEYFFQKLLEVYLDKIQIIKINGKENFSNSLSLIKKRPEFRDVKTLIICRDADYSPSDTFRSIKKVLQNNGFIPPINAFTYTNDNPKIGVIILPSDSESGCLEDFILKSIADYPEIQCINDVIECAKEKCGSIPNHLSKARIQAFLALQKEPGKRLGEAAKAGYFPLDKPEYKQLIKFITSCIL